MSVMLTAFLLFIALLIVAAAFIVLSDPSRVDAEEKSRVERHRYRYRLRRR